MKKTIYMSLLLIAFAGCKKSFLEITPTGRIVAETTSDYDLMLNSLTLGNQFMTYAQAMGDELAAFEPYYLGASLQQQRAFQWENTIYEPDEDAPEIQYPTLALYAYNKIINEVLNSKGGSEAQKNSVRAEALAGRAWVYIQLINTFAKPYNAATAATDLGFPIITEANVTVNTYPRKSVKEIYDFILKDLQDAIPYLSATPLHRFRMSKPAAEALLGKTYLFMGLYEESLVHLNNAMTGIKDSNYPFRLYDYNVDFEPGGELSPVNEYGPSFPNLFNNLENLYTRQTFGDWILTNTLLLTPETMALYGANDLRRRLMSETPFPKGDNFPLGMAHRISPFSPIIGMVVPDVYLMRAEVNARLGNLSVAKEDLERLRNKRMPSADAIVPTTIAADRIELIKFILDERIREFSALGYRWFDMRRLSVDPEFKSTVKYNHKLYAEDGSLVGNFILRPERLTFKIPQKILLENPDMQDNP
ncbi:RagB/SusD family nutrient uptake outer membrane protein [Sphingobacterium faecale]|uniref:RagB/SusD family nutrient uptake outer membrane protein n=1 Tax=Sphingobacterium faecale TaxID=2803775 RepID=A0ABS1QXS2_9SPHI|nr:RagB/SusD family nutrient uptake outer membrane protein [Sphingobacterium faecale]MBL1407213.1 RagB/SusD family nutrient uptake outer membrane protein [Sphingobacterium faecale]